MALSRLPRIGSCCNHAGSRSLQSKLFNDPSILISQKSQFRPYPFCWASVQINRHSMFSLFPSIVGLPPTDPQGRETEKGVSPQNCFAPPVYSTLTSVVYFASPTARRFGDFSLNPSYFHALGVPPHGSKMPVQCGRNPRVFRSLHHLRHVLGHHALPASRRL
jgi:hypothetical protein